MDGAITIVAIVIGFPILGGSAIAITAILRGWALKNREMKMRERRLQAEDSLKADEIHARLLQYDNLGVTPAEMANLLEEVRALRHEVNQLKQERLDARGTY